MVGASPLLQRGAGQIDVGRTPSQVLACDVCRGFVHARPLRSRATAVNATRGSEAAEDFTCGGLLALSWATIASAARMLYTLVMHLRWVAVWSVLEVACGHEPVQSDDGHMFLGNWECASGSRNIDCGQGIVTADLALGPSNLLQFNKGTATNILLLIPSRAIVPGLPGGPSCELAFDGNGYTAFLHSESTCVDDQGQDVSVHQGLADLGFNPSQLAFSTAATTSQSCSVHTQAVCYSVQ